MELNLLAKLKINKLENYANSESMLSPSLL